MEHNAPSDKSYPAKHLRDNFDHKIDILRDMYSW